MYYLIDQNGQFVSAIDGTAEDIVERTPEGYTTTILAPPRSTDYWNGSNWVAIGSAPAYYFKFNYVTKAWEDTRELEAVKTSKWNQIKLERNKAEFGGFLWEGLKFDSDQISQGRILAAFIFNQPIIWTLADDTSVELSVEDVQEVTQAMSNHVQNVHAKARSAREAINSATTIEEVESVLFNG